MRVCVDGVWSQVTELQVEVTPFEDCDAQLYYTFQEDCVCLEVFENGKCEGAAEQYYGEVVEEMLEE